MPSLKAALIFTNGSHFSGRASSGKIASTGHSGSQAPQSMHSSGSMTRMRSLMWMQSTGHTSMQERSLMSMHGSAITYVIANQCRRAPARPVTSGVDRREQPVDDLAGALEQRGLDHDAVEPRRVRA